MFLTYAYLLSLVTETLVPVYHFALAKTSGFMLYSHGVAKPAVRVYDIMKMREYSEFGQVRKECIYVVRSL